MDISILSLLGFLQEETVQLENQPQTAAFASFTPIQSATSLAAPALPLPLHPLATKKTVFWPCSAAHAHRGGSLTVQRSTSGVTHTHGAGGCDWPIHTAVSNTGALSLLIVAPLLLRPW